MSHHPQFSTLLSQQLTKLDRTPAWLARQLGVTHSTVGRWLNNGARPASPETVSRIADILGMAGDRNLLLVAAGYGYQERAQEPQVEIAGKVSAISPLLTASYISQARGNLPEYWTEFVGREAEIMQLTQCLLSPTCRLLTLIGPAGIGKTRLAAETAKQLSPKFPDGTYWVALGAIQSPGLVMASIAQALGVYERAGSKPLAVFVPHFLRGQRLLMVLDNFEHLLAAAPAIASLLGSCSGLSVLATSREPLHIYGEQEYPVSPLALPTLQHSNVDQRAVSQLAAVQLFVHRARAVVPDFEINNENVRAVAQICTRLDGLPLAIELAAARTKLLPLPTLLHRLERRLEVLTGGPLDVPRRHQTLRQALDWSYDLLDAEEKAFFRRLAIFAGGCTEDAVIAVWNANRAQQSTPSQVSDELSALVDKSLLRQLSTSTEPRFDLLETVREYGLEQLRHAGEEVETQRAHALYYLALAETAEPMLTGSEQSEWLDRLEVEHDNLRVALQWAVTQQEGEIGRRLGVALWHFWYIRGHHNEGWEWLHQLLLLSGKVVDEAKLHYGLGMLARRRADSTAVLAHFTRSLALFQQENDQRGVASALRGLGFIHYVQNDNATAHRLLEEALTRFRDLNDLEGTAVTLSNLGYVAHQQRDLVRARALQEESLAQRRVSGNRHGMAANLASLSYVAMDEENLVMAQAYAQECLSINRELQNRNGVGMALLLLGQVAFRQGEYGSAYQYYRECLEVSQEIRDESLWPEALFFLATTSLKQGDLVNAEVLLRKCLKLYSARDMKFNIAETLEYLAVLATVQHRPEHALTLAGAVVALRRSDGYPRISIRQEEYEEMLAQAWQALDPRTAMAAWSRGENMILDEAIALASPPEGFTQ